jgi:hypothetical protein
MSQHTPGPWHWTDHVSPHITIYAKNDQKIVVLTEPFYRDSQGVGVANADLIAAAPDLLAACKAAHEFSRVFSDSYVQMLAHAIAKAEGRDQ